MDDDIAIKVEHINKTFHEQVGARSFKEAFVNMGKKISGKKTDKISKDFTALKDINFEVKKGEFFGIVGRNGSGKSTLLKIMAGVYSSTNGAIGINGNLTPFIELGVGFNPELSGKDNVYLNAALLGFTRKQTEAIYKDIVDFAELKEFMDVKLKNYSSGMQVRLAFSVAIRAESDILLIDEVLAVGDAAFQKKCFDYFEELREKKLTVVFISHDMAAINRFCTNVAYIENGKILEIGKAEDITYIYNKKNINIAKQDDYEKESLLQVSLNKKDSYIFGDDLEVCLDWHNLNKEVGIVGVAILKDGQTVFATNSTNMLNLQKIKKCKLKIKIDLGPGIYKILVVAFGDNDNDPIDYNKALSFEVIAKNRYGKKGEEWLGITYIDSSWSK